MGLWTKILSFFGATGSQGPAGNDGLSGPAGIDGEIAGRGPTGEVGYTGPRGPDGPDNDFSNDRGVWLDSPKYFKGNYVVDPLDNNFYVCLIENEGTDNPSVDNTGSWNLYALGGVTGSDNSGSGPKGRDGDVGPTGSDGGVGDQGPKGEDNTTTGSTGTDGPQGPEGPTGPDGIDGLPGRDNTVKGNTGPAGDTGDKGPNNYVTGSDGPQGPVGFYIPSFTTWVLDSSYELGAIVKYNGSLYALTGIATGDEPSVDTNWTLYFDKGTGITGGAGAPAASAMFKTGDLYFNTETSELYAYNVGEGGFYDSY
jgi:hypothetical protein